MQLQISNTIRLELSQQKHAPQLFAAIDNNREHLAEFLPWVGAMQTLENAKAYLYRCEQLYQQKADVSFVIFVNETLVGRIGLHHLDNPNKTGAIGYWLSKDAEGQGIITNASKALINYGFKELELERIEIKAAIENLKSQAIPTKLGFKKEGILRHAELVNNRFVDLVLSSMLANEWVAK